MVLFQVQPGQSTVFLCANPNYEPNSVRADSLAKDAGKRVHIATQGLPNLESLGGGTVDVVLSEAPSFAEHSLDLLLKLFRVLRSDGALVLREPLEGRTFEVSEKLKGLLTMSGFINTTITPSPPYVEIVSRKPNWEVGATQKISLIKKPAVSSASTVKTAAAWSKDSSADLIDESSLLSEVDIVRPNDPMEVDDTTCATSKRACANCVCGRADKEANGEKTKLTLAMIENPAVESSCGSCAMGDAFRCAGCPYKGLPAFKPGEKIVLPDDFFLDDI